MEPKNDQQEKRNLLPNHFEIETKYEISGDKLHEWKQLVSSFEGVKEFIYVESDDIYYTKKTPQTKADEDEFIRYRYATTTKQKRAELTVKKKTGEANNIFRYETNLRVDHNNRDTIENFVEILGYKKNFRISKPGVHIYVFDEVTLPFYTVIDEDNNVKHFIEIEVNEDLIPSLTEEEAWEIVRKWEKELAILGIKAQNRIRRSLFEMYRKP